MTIRAVDVGRKQVAAAQEANELARESVMQAIGSGRQQDEANRTSMLLSRQSFEQTVVQNRLDQRAWVGLNRVMLEPDLNLILPGKKLRVSFTFQNTGKTIGSGFEARVLAVWTAPDQRNLAASRALERLRRRKPVAATDILPQQLITTYSEVDADVDNGMLGEIQLGQKEIFGVGWAHYRDAFGQAHRSNFCYRYDPDVRAMVPCVELNAAN